MRTLRTMKSAELLELRTVIKDAIEAMAELDMMVADVSGLRQAGAEWSAAAECLRKVNEEQSRRATKGVLVS